jgi:putative tryptophan/tyrosine transport system substrate-binding protein
MLRREFIALTIAAAAWPLTVRAQQDEAVRRIGLLLNAAENDSLGQAGLAAFRKSLQQLGWGEGHNLLIDVRWGANDVERDRQYAAELIGLKPDVILAAGTLSVAAVQRATHVVPIVFIRVTDPVGAGFISSLAQPGGNITGFMLFEYSISVKWLELLKEIAPQVTRLAVLRDSANPAAIAQYSVIQSAAQPFGIDVKPIDMHDREEVSRAVAAFARTADGGLIITPSAGVSKQRGMIVALAARFKLPTVYGEPTNAASGGLVSYGPDRVHQYQLAAGYVDRILKGESPGALPVQAPTKYILTINLKTAKALKLNIPAALLARADEVIE